MEHQQYKKKHNESPSLVVLNVMLPELDGFEVCKKLCFEGNLVPIIMLTPGPGIKKDDKLKIFEQFYQVDKSRKGGEGRGVGLGLAITKQIMSAHGGEIWVESDGKNGSTFVVKLPLEH